jgi:hypothetical protein
MLCNAVIRVEKTEVLDRVSVDIFIYYYYYYYYYYLCLPDFERFSETVVQATSSTKAIVANFGIQRILTMMYNI